MKRPSDGAFLMCIHHKRFRASTRIWTIFCKEKAFNSFLIFIWYNLIVPEMQDLSEVSDDICRKWENPEEKSG